MQRNAGSPGPGPLQRNARALGRCNATLDLRALGRCNATLDLPALGRCNATLDLRALGRGSTNGEKEISSRSLGVQILGWMSKSWSFSRSRHSRSLGDPSPSSVPFHVLAVAWRSIPFPCPFLFHRGRVAVISLSLCPSPLLAVACGSQLPWLKDSSPNHHSQKDVRASQRLRSCCPALCSRSLGAPNSPG